ncbi:hypothetical protein H0H92_002333 [Tricholoma furcatifolium]|nr:hypothetical protein H0H92_002333 [Tricholoma furcatifolium]
MTFPTIKRKAIRLAWRSDEERFVKEVTPAFLRAVEAGKLDEYLALLQILWEDRFPDPMKVVDGVYAAYVENDLSVWQRKVSSMLLDCAPSARADGDYKSPHFDDWEVWMSLDCDRSRRRSSYFSTADFCGEYLRGHQYDVVISPEERTATEVSPEEFSERVWARLLKAIPAAFREN